MFVLDQSIGAFVLVKTHIRIPSGHKVYSINEAYVEDFPPEYREYLEFAHKNGYSSRYIGSMVADVHRTLLLGGVFLYPPTGSHAAGKLRLMYEANPMAMIVEEAGGKAMCAPDARILEIRPEALHQRTPVILGSSGEVDIVLKFLEGKTTP